MRALRRSATAEAVAQLAMGLETLQQLPATAIRERRELDLQVAYGAALVAARGPAAPEPAKAYMRARELCRQLGEERNLLPVLFGLWASHNVRNELRAAHTVATELLDLARQKPLGPTIILGYRALGTTQLLQGDFTASRENLRRLLSIDRPAVRALFRFSLSLRSMADGSSLSFHICSPARLPGAGTRSRSTSACGGASAPTSQHFGPGPVLSMRAWPASPRHGRPRDACRSPVDRRRRAAASRIWLAAGAVFRGWSLAESGKLSDGIAQMRDGLAAYEATGAQAYASDMMGLLAEVHRRAGNADQGQRLLHDALEHTKRAGACAGEAELHRLQGELHLSLPSRNLIDAQASFRRALEVARNQEARWLELRAAVSLARLLVELGERQEASDLLRRIHGWFTEGANTPDLQDAQTLLEELL